LYSAKISQDNLGALRRGAGN